MRKSILFSLAFVTAFSLPVWAQEGIPMDCMVRLMAAEESDGTDTRVYDECGFGNEKTAWETWAGAVSEKKMKKALFQLCDRYPNHAYGALYCRKSAQLGYGPALAAVGHMEMAAGNAAPALRLYTQALATPDLTPGQEGDIAERLGIYYLTPNTPQFDPEKAMFFLDRAAKNRSAVANNILGYASFTGQYGAIVDYKNAFESFWRAILLGCLSAEENLGLFHLARQEKIEVSTAEHHMKRNLLSCTPVPVAVREETTEQRPDCNCATVLETEKRYRAQPYLLDETKENTAVLLKADGAKLLVRLNEELSDGYWVREIRPSAVILTKGSDRAILNIYKPDDCVAYCREHPDDTPVETAPVETVTIKPYRLTFTADECETIRQYAPTLVDIDLPFTGKSECALDAGVKDEDALIRLMTERDAVEEPAVPEPMPLSDSDKSFLYRAGQGLTAPEDKK